MYHSKLFGNICAFLLLSVLYVNAQTGEISTTGGSVGTGTTGTTGIVFGTTGTTGVDVVYTAPLSNQTNTDVSVSLPSGDTIQISFPPLPGCVGCTASYSQASQGDTDFENPSNAPPSGATFSGVSLFISVTDSNGNPVHVIPRTTITITTGNDVTNQRLFLFNTSSGTWEDASLTCSPAHVVVDVQANTLHVDICHLTQFATFNHPIVSTSSASSTSGGGVTKPAASSGTNSGLIAIVIVVPIVVVGVIIALVAWTLLRNRKNNSDSNPNNTVEMGTRKVNDTPKTSATNVASSPSVTAPKKVPESSTEEESESEEESEEEGKAKKESESEEESEKKAESESESESSESESESKSK